MHISEATSDLEIRDCYPVFKELRPHLVESDFLSRVRRQQEEGYHLLFARDPGGVAAAAAGYRMLHFLAWGHVLYLDDLITLPGRRGMGFGGSLLDRITAIAREHRCDEVHLDSGPQRHDAHRLYLNKGFKLNSHHLSLQLDPAFPP